MAFSTPPEATSMVGDAGFVRHVYVSGLTKSYAVWKARIGQAGFYIVMRPMDPVEYLGADFTDLIVAGPFPTINSFAVQETSVPGVVAVVFEQADGLWVLEYDCINEVLSSGPTQLYKGTHPSISEGLISVLLMYIRTGSLKLRSGLSGDEKEVVRPSSTDVIDQDTHEKIGVPTVVRYAGLVGQNATVARKFIPTVNSEALFDCGLVTQALGTWLIVEEITEAGYSITGPNPGIRGNNVFPGVTSAVGTGESYLFLSPEESQERWGLTFGEHISGFPDPDPIPLGDMWSFHVWMITPQTNYESVFLRAYASDGSYINIHLPWSNGDLYFDIYDSSLNLDRINQAMTLSASMEHWVFTQNSLTGVRKIYRNGVEWHSGTSLFNSIPDISRLYIGSDGEKNRSWDGEIAEFAIFGYEMGAPKVAELAAGLPGYLTADEPGLVRFWPFDNIFLSALYDLSGNGNDMILYGQDYDVQGLEIQQHIRPQISQLPAGSGLTLEAWVAPRLSAYEAYVIESGEMSFGYKNTGELFFTVAQPNTLYTNTSGSISSFADGGGGTQVQVNCTAAHGLSSGAVVAIYGANGYTGYHHVASIVDPNAFIITETWNATYSNTGSWAIVPEMRFVQKSGRVMDPYRLNYIAVSHVFGDASSTFMVINGSVVEASWDVGSGDLSPGYTQFTGLDFRLGYRDRLFQWHIQSAAKPLSEIRDYSKGKV